MTDLETRGGADLGPRQGLAPGEQTGLVGLDGEHVVPAPGGNGGRGSGLGVHRISGDHRPDQVERFEQGPQCGDLVALDRDLHLPEHDPQRVVQSRDQMRGEVACGPGTPHSLAVDRDDSTSAQHPDTGTHPGPQDRVEALAVQARQRPTGRGLTRALPRHDAEPGQRARVGVGDPLPDRGERASPGQHRGQRHRQDHRELVAHPAAATRIRNLLEELQQTRTGQPAGLDARCCNRRR